MSYATEKGNGLQPAPATPRARPPRELSETEREQAARHYALLKKHLPELVPLVKELHEAGLIDGLRAIQNVQVINGKEP